MRLKEKIQRILRADKAVREARESDNLQLQLRICLVVAASFFLLTLFNIFTPTTEYMLFLTSAATVVLLAGALLGWRKKSADVIMRVELCVVALAFTVFTIIGGNDGFAVLWLTIAPAVMIVIVDFRLGVYVGTYFFVMLAVLFWTPLRGHFSVYTQTFMMRFPALYLISMVLAVFVGVRVRLSMYKQLVSQQGLEALRKSLEDDVHLLAEKRKEAEYRAAHDELTGLYNREYLQVLKEQGKIDRLHTCGAIYFDVNNLKKVNDEGGHEAGDRLLTVFAKSLQAVAGLRALPFRMGGDEFMLLVMECGEKEMEALQVSWRAALEQLNEKETVKCGAAVGEVYARGPICLEEMIREADERMYEDKRKQKLTRQTRE